MENVSIIDTTRHDTTRHDRIACPPKGTQHSSLPLNDDTNRIQVLRPISEGNADRVVHQQNNNKPLSSPSSPAQQHNTYKLAFILPTKDRPEFLDVCLEAMRSSYSRFNVLVYVLDGSKDDKSFQVYEKYKTDWIIYEHLPATTLQYRFFHALNNIDAEYICLTKDNFFPVPETAEEVMQILDKGYDYLQFTSSKINDAGEKEFSSVAECCKGTMPCNSSLFGSVFIRKFTYRLATYEEHCKEYGENEFFYLIYYYNYPISKTFRGFITSKLFPYDLSSKLRRNRRSHWYTRELNFEIWGKDWLRAIKSFRFLSDDEKKEVAVSRPRVQSASGWVGFRFLGIFDRELYMKYENEIKQITRVDQRIIYAIAITPVPILRVAFFVYRCLRKAKSLLTNH